MQKIIDIRHDNPQTITRRLLAPLVFLISMLPSAVQAQEWVQSGLTYDVFNVNNEFFFIVTGRASGNTATDIVIPATVYVSATGIGT